MNLLFPNSLLTSFKSNRAYKLMLIVSTLFIFVQSSLSQTTLLHHADFESGTDGWTGTNSNRVTGVFGRIYRGNSAMELFSGVIRGRMQSPVLALSGFDKVEFEFFFSPLNFNNGDGFVVEYSSNNGSSWSVVQSFNRGNTLDFRLQNAGNFYAKTVILHSNDYSFTNNSRFRIRNVSALGPFLFVDAISIIGTRYIPPTKAPGGVNSNLDLWLRADMVDGFHALTDNQPVNSWKDKALGHHARVVDSIRAGTFARPIYKDNSTDNLNFNPSILFSRPVLNTADNHNVDYLHSDFPFLFGTGGFSNQEFFVVVEHNSTVGELRSPGVQNQALIGAKSPATNNFDPDETGIGFENIVNRLDNEIITYAQGNNPSTNPIDPNLRGYASGEISDPVIYPFGKRYQKLGILNVRKNDITNRIDVYLNGNLISNTEVGIPQFADIINQRFWLGRRQTRDSEFMGRIAEVVAYSSPKNLMTEHNKIESYLALKYGITLGINGISKDYVDSDGNIIYPMNINFNYNVSGIGRDDASLLNQKQSKSFHSKETIDDITVGIGDLFTTNTTNNFNFNNDKSFLLWGHNNAPLAKFTLASINLSADIAPFLETVVGVNIMQRTWQVKEVGNVGSVKLSVPKTLLNSPPLSTTDKVLMVVSASPDFNNDIIDFVEMKEDGSAFLTSYDFDGTMFISFGTAPVLEFERSIAFNDATGYLEIEQPNLDLSAKFTISTWVKRRGDGVLLSNKDQLQTEGFNLEILTDGRIGFSWANGGSLHQINSSVTIPENIWHQIAITFDGSNLKLYIDGIQDLSVPADFSTLHCQRNLLVGAAVSEAPTNFFNGAIDELRIWNTSLTKDQINYVLNQELINLSGQITGKYFQNIAADPGLNEIEGLPWSTLSVYLPMSKYWYLSTLDESENGYIAKLRNLRSVDLQTAPLPFKSANNGNWFDQNTWSNGNFQYIPGSVGLLGYETQGNIVEIRHNITISQTATLLGLISNANELSVQNSGLFISHFLRLNGIIDLQDEAQLIQPEGSDLDVQSIGLLKRGQKGTPDNFTYNYFSSPVGEINTSSNNNNYSVGLVLKDATDPLNPQNINFVTSFKGADGTPTSPITISSYWIFKFNGPVGDFNAWEQIREVGILKAGEGFTMKGPNTASISSHQLYKFIGKPNNGNIELPITGGNNYLVGNPYPSALDADKFILDNPNTSGTLYFWQHEGGGSHRLRDYVGGYHTYNLAGSVGYMTAPPTLPGSSVVTPGRYIPVGQGFFVEGITNGNILFNNSQRAFVKESSGQSVFFKVSDIKNVDSLDNRIKIRLGYVSPLGYYRQLLLTIDQRASLDFDWGFDGPSADNQIEDMYWVLNNKPYTIQAIDRISPETSLPIGIKSNQSGSFQIKLDKLENAPNNLNIFLRDKNNNTLHDLKSNEYTGFIESPDIQDNRFEIVFAPEETLSNDKQESSTAKVTIFFDKKNNQLNILNQTNKVLNKVTIYNMLGQEINNISLGSTQIITQVSLTHLSNSIYIVKAHFEDMIVNNKIIKN